MEIFLAGLFWTHKRAQEGAGPIGKMLLLVLEVLFPSWQRGGILAEPTHLGMSVSSPPSDLEF